MKIAYICTDPGIPVFGTKGASIHVREVVAALRSQGHELRVYSPDIDPAANPEPDVFRRVVLSGIAAELAPALRTDVQAVDHLANEYTRLLYVEFLQRVLLPELESWQPDFIYERYALFGYAGVELARRLRVPLVMEVNAPLREEQERYRILALRETGEKLERRILTSAGALFVVSEPLAAFARGIGVDAGRIEVLPNAVDTDRFSPEVAAAPDARFGVEDERLIGFVGTLKPWHDVDTLVQAVGMLHARDARYRLLMVGDGPRYDDLVALQAPYLRLYGAVDHARVPALLAAMDLIAVPYGGEDDPYFSPLKLFEAMAMAKPVVGARVGQVPLIIEDGVDGLLYEPGDAAGLASRIEAAFARGDRGAALGAAAREKVLAKYTWRANAGRIARRVETLLQESVAHGR